MNAKTQLSESGRRKQRLDEHLSGAHPRRTTCLPLRAQQPPATAPLPASPSSSTSPALPAPPSSPSPHGPSPRLHGSPSSRSSRQVLPPLPSISNYNYPSTLTCPCCKNAVLTVVNLESGNTTYLWCVTIGLCISPLCCCIPFLMESCLDKSHYCPNCGHNIMRKHQKCFEFLGCWMIRIGFISIYASIWTLFHWIGNHWLKK